MANTLLNRLKEHRGSQLSLNALGFSSEPGQLQRISHQFIKVSGQYFVAETVNEIVLLQLPTKPDGKKLLVRTTYRAPFTAKLVHIGSDYIELIEASAFTKQHLLVPLTKVVSIETV